MAWTDLTIGRAAKIAGVTRKAVRVYETKGLLPGIQRTRAGYRLFGQEDIDRLRFIRRARMLGLHLDDIGEVLAIRASGNRPCPTVRCMLDARIDEVDTAITDLLALRKTLAEARGRADRSGRTSRADSVCGIIEDP